MTVKEARKLVEIVDEHTQLEKEIKRIEKIIDSFHKPDELQPLNIDIKINYGQNNKYVEVAKPLAIAFLQEIVKDKSDKIEDIELQLSKMELK